MAKNKANGLKELFVEQLKDIYWAEKELTKSMPKMAEKAASKELKKALEQHHKITEKQVKRVEKVFDSLGMEKSDKKCEGMAGLIKEGEEMMKEAGEGMVRDAAIIAAAQKVEHYEIASYGTMSEFARILGENEAESLLNEILEEEKEADRILTEVASGINVEAKEEPEKMKAH